LSSEKQYIILQALPPEQKVSEKTSARQVDKSMIPALLVSAQTLSSTNYLFRIDAMDCRGATALAAEPISKTLIWVGPKFGISANSTHRRIPAPAEQPAK
jgi:hypothetical protein